MKYLAVSIHISYLFRGAHENYMARELHLQLRPQSTRPATERHPLASIHQLFLATDRFNPSPWTPLA